jgi:hypothetical protein
MQEHYYRQNEPDVELSSTQYQSLSQLLKNERASALGNITRDEGILQTWTGNQLVHHYLTAPEDKEGEKNMSFVKKQDKRFKPGKLRIALPFSPEIPGLLVPATYRSNPKDKMLEQWLKDYDANLL